MPVLYACCICLHIGITRNKGVRSMIEHNRITKIFLIGIMSLITVAEQVISYNKLSNH